MISYKFARRSFLRGCGGSAGLLLPLLRSMEARAQGIAAPRRLLILHHSQGSPIDLWRPASTTTTTSFTLPANSAPFAPLQSKMVMIDGLNLVPLDPKGSNSGQNTSEGGMVALMTGVPALGMIGQQDHCAGGPSIDQILLDQSPLLGGAMSSTKTPFGSLQLSADVRSSRDEVAPRVMSYRAPIANSNPGLARQPLNPETQPLNAFKRLFGGAAPGLDQSAALARELSVLDFMRRDLARLRTLAPATEKARLDVHADAIRQVEATLRQTIFGTPLACTTPAQPPTFTTTAPGRTNAAGEYTSLSGVDYYDPQDPNNHPHQALGQAHLALIKAAFLCDLTRVVTFSWSSATSWVVFPGTFDGATLTGAPMSSPHYPPLSADPSTSPGAGAWWTAIDRFYSQQSSLAIQAMAAATDVDGNSLLDNTVVVYVTELSRRWDHDQRNMPLLVFGGKNTGLKGGTFRKVTDGALPSQTGASTGNRPFNDFWLSLAAAFGVDLRSLGAANQFTGPLSGVFG